MSWRLARSLAVLRSQINDLSPNRSKISDGTIGNQEHASRVSDHNPNAAGVVTAMDITHDPQHGIDSEKLLVVKGMGMTVNEKDMPGGGLSLFDVENDHQTTLVDQFELAGLVKPYFAPASGPDSLAIRRVLKSEAAPGGHRVQTEAFDEKGRKYRLDFAIANQQAKLTNVVIYK